MMIILINQEVQIMKKFDKITRDGKYNYHKIGDLITVTEKLDGANA